MTEESKMVLMKNIGDKFRGEARRHRISTKTYAEWIAFENATFNPRVKLTNAELHDYWLRNRRENHILFPITRRSTLWQRFKMRIWRIQCGARSIVLHWARRIRRNLGGSR